MLETCVNFVLLLSLAKKVRVSRMRNHPIHKRDPWDFYKTFRVLSPALFLVLCEDETEVRTMRIFGDAPTEDEVEFPILAIPHPNFVLICEGYLFRNEIFTILEYVGFSVEDLLQHSIHPQEGEIAYIISQVGLANFTSLSSF